MRREPGVQRLLVSVLGPGLRLRHAVRAGGGGPHGRAWQEGRPSASTVGIEQVRLEGAGEIRAEVVPHSAAAVVRLQYE
jgi:hypothetical protein